MSKAIDLWQSLPPEKMVTMLEHLGVVFELDERGLLHYTLPEFSAVVSEHQYATVVLAHDTQSPLQGKAVSVNNRGWIFADSGMGEI